MSAVIVKLMIIGDSSTGKTQLISSFITGKTISTEPTKTISLHSAMLKIRDMNIKAHLMDNPGSRLFFNVIKSYWSNSHGALICYDVSNRTSFESTRAWIQNYKAQCSIKEPSIMICGNKCHKTNREVSTEEGEQLALEYGCLFFEASAMNNTNIQPMFNALIKKALDALHPSLKESVLEISIPHTPTKYFHSADMLLRSPQEVLKEEKVSAHSLWDRTVDLLDWLIPESLSDDEVSEEEIIPALSPAPLPRRNTVKRPLAPRSSSLMPAQRMLTRKKTVKKEDEFSTSSLVDFLNGQKPLQDMMDESDVLKRDSGKFFAPTEDIHLEMLKIDNV
jgi:small GTP-binding protein